MIVNSVFELIHIEFGALSRQELKSFRKIDDSFQKIVIVGNDIATYPTIFCINPFVIQVDSCTFAPVLFKLIIKTL